MPLRSARRTHHTCNHVYEKSHSTQTFGKSTTSTVGHISNILIRLGHRVYIVFGLPCKLNTRDATVNAMHREGGQEDLRTYIHTHTRTHTYILM